jgi:hypothetical protein
LFVAFDWLFLKPRFLQNVRIQKETNTAPVCLSLSPVQDRLISRLDQRAVQRAVLARRTGVHDAAQANALKCRRDDSPASLWLLARRILRP